MDHTSSDARRRRLRRGQDPALRRIHPSCVTTIPVVPGRVIRTTLGLVHAEAAIAISVLGDIATNFRDDFGGRAKTIETALGNARQHCMHELKKAAAELGADAIVGVRLDLTAPTKSVLIFVAIGTAVVTEPDDVPAVTPAPEQIDLPDGFDLPDAEVLPTEDPPPTPS